MEAAITIELESSWQPMCFKELLIHCRGVSDVLLVIEFIAKRVDQIGDIISYLANEGYDSAIFLRLAIAIRTIFKILKSELPESYCKDDGFDELVFQFITQSWNIIRNLSPDENVFCSMDSPPPKIWLETLGLHYALRSIVARKVTPKSFKAFDRGWASECLKQLPDLKHYALRCKLGNLEYDYRDQFE